MTLEQDLHDTVTHQRDLTAPPTRTYRNMVGSEQLRAMRETRDALDEMILRQVIAMRQAYISWATIGEIFGITAQGAQKRWKYYAPIERRHYQRSTTTVKPVSTNVANLEETS